MYSFSNPSWDDVHRAQSFLQNKFNKKQTNKSKAQSQDAREERRKILMNKAKPFLISRWKQEPLTNLTTFSRRVLQRMSEHFKDCEKEHILEDNERICEIFYHIRLDEKGQPLFGLPLRDLDVWLVSNEGRLIELGRISLPYDENNNMLFIGSNSQSIKRKPLQWHDHSIAPVRESYLVRSKKNTHGYISTKVKQEWKQDVPTVLSSYQHYLRLKLDDEEEVLKYINKHLRYMNEEKIQENKLNEERIEKENISSVEDEEVDSSIEKNNNDKKVEMKEEEMEMEKEEKNEEETKDINNNNNNNNTEEEEIIQEQLEKEQQPSSTVEKQ